MPAGKLTIQAFKDEQAAKRERMARDAAREVIAAFEKNYRRLSWAERFCLRLAMA